MMFFKICFLRIAFALLLIPSTLCITEAALYSEPLHRSRRQLLFPNSTLLQFNAGIGTPTPDKNINVNFAFQANFQLPWNRTQIPLDILEANSGYDGLSRKKRDIESEDKIVGDYDNDARLYHLYKYVEDVLNSFGYHGRSCVLRTLCQLGAEPLHSNDEEDLLHDLASFVLNPTNDILKDASQKSEAQPYIQAHTRGQKLQNCTKIYHKCSLSLIDIFTKLHDATNHVTEQ